MDGKLVKIEELRKCYEISNHNIHQLIEFYETFVDNSCFPPGHYYSPIIDIEEVKSDHDKIFDNTIKTLPEINLNFNEQTLLLKEFQTYVADMPFPEIQTADFRYFFNNDVFSYTDGMMLYFFMRHFKPTQIIEVGSGFSSALMLDTNNLFFENSLKFTFIEPFPDRLYSLIRKEDQLNNVILKNRVQDIDVASFQELGSNDILFIDGSHVSKTGSDLNYLLFEVIPFLKKGVIIHFHDIFHNFEYLPSWVYEGRNWNECYLLRSFLSFNDSFKILMFNNYMHVASSDELKRFPGAEKNHGGSLWIQKTK